VRPERPFPRNQARCVGSRSWQALSGLSASSAQSFFTTGRLRDDSEA
jgi:hypothetical protein